MAGLARRGSHGPTIDNVARLRGHEDSLRSEDLLHAGYATERPRDGIPVPDSRGAPG
jgi:hypothetical protein